MKILQLGLLLSLLAFSCNEAVDYSLGGDAPEAPQIQVEDLMDGTNRYVVTDLSSGNFVRLWDFGSEGKPKTSTLVSDTVQYAKAGSYTIRLNVSASDGNGTNISEYPVTVLENAAVGCDETLIKLTEFCTSGCWHISTDPTAVKVGPTPLSGEWFTSNGLEATQLDDLWCFNGEDFTIDYQNSGSSFSACQGYVEVPDYPIIPNSDWEYGTDTGVQGLPRITLLESIAWIGVEDSGPTYDIFELTETTMTLIAPIKPCDGAPSPGYFTISFEKL